jgi:membrane complex biogenesis BtpA family protein
VKRRFRDVFGSGKALVGVIHLGALPGSPAYEGDMRAVVGRAVREARLLAGCGFNGLIVENYGDLPFLSGRVEADTTAAMAVVASEIRQAVRIPLGINVLRNDARTALAIAGVVGCEFVRVNVLVGAFTTSEGLVEGEPGEVQRYRDRVAPGALIFADTLVKHASPLAPTTLADDVLDVVERGRADAVIVTGARTGRPPAGDDLETVRTTLRDAGLAVPVLVGSGSNPLNAEDFLRLSDGLVVGSYIRKHGRAGEAIDGRRAAAMGKIRHRIRA